MKMAVNVTSDKVKIFPSTRRSSSQISSRALTQAALVGLINQLLDRQSFVISQNNSDGKFVFDDISFIQVNICGYYFRIDKSQITSFLTDHNYTKVYLCAQFMQGDTDYPITELPRMNLIGNTQSYIEFNGQVDVDAVSGSLVCLGLKLSQTQISSTGWKSFQILQWVQGENPYWRIPQENQIKFETTRIPRQEQQITGVDGGDGTPSP